MTLRLQVICQNNGEKYDFVRDCKATQPPARLFLWGLSLCVVTADAWSADLCFYCGVRPYGEIINCSMANYSVQRRVSGRVMCAHGRELGGPQEGMVRHKGCLNWEK